MTILTGSDLLRTVGEAVIIGDLFSGGTRRLRPVDAVVVADPNRAETALLDGLRTVAREIHVIGDCYAPRAATAAVHEGHRAGRLL